MKIEIEYNPTLEDAKAAIRKAHRSAIRLKYGLLADAEITRTLPQLDRRIAFTIQQGLPLELEAGKVFSEFSEFRMEGETDEISGSQDS